MAETKNPSTSPAKPEAQNKIVVSRPSAFPGDLSKISKPVIHTKELNMPAERVSTTVPLNWKEVWFTNCPMVSANNVDQELGWCREEFKKIGVEYAYFRHAPENNWYPHYIHNLDNLIRFGGLYPPIHVHADIRRTRLLGATWVYEGGGMVVRANDKIFRMKDLKGKKIGISKSLNTIKNDWWRIQEHMGIENMLMLHDMTMDDIQARGVPVSGRLV